MVSLSSSTGPWAVHPCFHKSIHKLYLFETKLMQICALDSLTSSPSLRQVRTELLSCWPDQFFPQPFLLLQHYFLCNFECHSSFHFLCGYFTDASIEHLKAMWNWIQQVHSLQCQSILLALRDEMYASHVYGEPMNRLYLCWLRCWFLLWSQCTCSILFVLLSCILKLSLVTLASVGNFQFYLR